MFSLFEGTLQLEKRFGRPSTEALSMGSTSSDIFKSTTTTTSISLSLASQNISSSPRSCSGKSSGTSKRKPTSVAPWIFTQMFFDVDLFIRWVKAVREAGITVPIVPGVMPIQNWNGFQKATRMANTVVPQHFLDVLEPVKNNDEEVRKLGVKLVADMCRTILNSDLDIHGIHIYTMNLEKGTRMLLEELNLVPRIESIKPLPWRQVSSKAQRLNLVTDSSYFHSA
jgi:hypothetical protein